MNDQIAATAQSILSDSLSYFLTMLFIQGLVVLRIFLRGGADYTVRERLMASLPLQFAVMLVGPQLVCGQHMEDLLVVGHTHPWLGLYTWSNRGQLALCSS